VTSFEWLKLIHVSCALVSVSGFALRGYWKLSDNPLLTRRPARILPHIIDTLLLGSAAGMLVIWEASPFQFDWIVAKLLGLLAYIALGMVALRFSRSAAGRITAYLLALACAAYILSVAFSKSPGGLLSLAAG
jgi:uncharacterized membrane protein SirB2